jgi:cell volume regulation protein A
VIVALVLMLVARPLAVLVCLVPFRFNWREKVFIAWTGLRGAVAIFLASIPMLVGLSKAYLYFDVAFVVVVISLLLQGWTLGPAARWLHVALPRADRAPRRVELDLPGQLEQQLVGYPVRAKSLYFRRGLLPSWSKPTLVIRDQRILSPVEADPVAAGDYLYLLAPPEKAEALDRFFVDMPPSSAPDPHLLGDFMVSGDRDRGLAGAAVADDEFALSAANRDHRVDRHDTGQQRLRDRAARDDAVRDLFDGISFLRVDRALSIDRAAEGVDDAAEQRLANGN